MLLTKKEPGLIPHHSVKQAIGWLGILMPAAMVIGNFLLSSCQEVQSSISHYYYTITGHWFVGILCAVALFLIAYKGYNRIDTMVSSAAGVAALLIAFFPTNRTKDVPVIIVDDGCQLFSLPEHGIRNAVHYAAAGLFFCTLAGMSLFLFTKSNGATTEQKDQRNVLFRISGVIIICAVILIFLYGLFGKPNDWVSRYKPVFWLEWIALFAFGVSWLVKGGMVLKDKRADH